MVSKSIELEANKWVEISNEDCAVQYKQFSSDAGNRVVYLVEDTTKPTSEPISVDDADRATILSNGETANIANLGGNTVYAYCTDSIFLRIS